MQQNKVKVVVRRCAYLSIVAFDIISSHFYDLAAMRTENFDLIPGAPYVLWLINLLFVSAADFLREEPGWRVGKCWLRRAVYATAIFYCAIALFLLWLLIVLRSDAEMMAPPAA